MADPGGGHAFDLDDLTLIEDVARRFRDDSQAAVVTAAWVVSAAQRDNDEIAANNRRIASALAGLGARQSAW